MTFPAPHIPFDALDNFYFEQFVPTLHPTLQICLIDHRYLHHAAHAGVITSLREFMPFPEYYYLCTPFMLNDLFELPADLLLQLGQIHVLEFVENILLDNIADQQVPDVSMTSLAVLHIRQWISSQYRQLFTQEDDFWQIYDETNQANWNALALEKAYVVQHVAPLYPDVFHTICYGKSAAFVRTINAIGRLSGKKIWIKSVIEMMHALWLADIFMDDANDWEKDLDQRRRTLPLVMGMVWMGMPPEQFNSLTQHEIKALIRQSAVIPTQMESAAAALEEALLHLTAFGHPGSRLGHVLQMRLEVAQHAKISMSVHQAISFFLERL